MKTGVSTVIMDGRHHPYAAKLFQEYGSFSWIVDRFREYLVVWIHGADIAAAEAIKPSQVSKSYTAMVCSDTFTVDTSEALSNYVSAFYQQHGVHSADALINDVLNDTMSSDYLPTGSRSTYKRYIRFTKLTIESKKLLDLLLMLDYNWTKRNSPGISHLDGAVHYVAELQIDLRIFEAAHFCFTNPTKYPAFHATFFSATVQAALLEFLNLYETHFSTQHRPSATPKNVKLQDLTWESCTVKLFFLNNMSVFVYHFHDKKERWLDSTLTRKKFLVSRVGKALEVQCFTAAITKQAPQNVLSRIAEGVNLSSQNLAVYNGGENFQGNPEQAATPKAKNQSSSGDKDMSETSDLIKYLRTLPASSLTKKQKTMTPNSTPQSQSVQLKTPLSTV